MKPQNRINAELSSSPTRRRPAIVLIAVLVVVTMLSLAAYKYTDLMMAEYKAADNVLRSAQAKAYAESGVNYAAAILSDPTAVEGLLGGNPLGNHSESFHGYIVQQSDIARFQGKFTIIATPLPGAFGDEGDTYRFGVMDESSKINVNAMMRMDNSGDDLYDVLKKLPNMTEDIAAAMVDWLDEDTEPRPGGAEDETYSQMTPPYRCKNGPIDSIDELLLVRGMTPELFYGNDLNRNGLIDGNEVSSDDPLMDLGWSAYLTIYSREQNISSDLQPRINLNEKDLASLSSKLSGIVDQNLATFILLWRLYDGRSLPKEGSGNSKSKKSNVVTTVSTANLDLKVKPKQKLHKIRSLFELVDSQVTIPSQGKGKPSQTVLSPLNDPAVQRQYLPILFDKTTTSRETDIPARININTAPEGVLYALPELTANEVQAILTFRPTIDNFQMNDPQYGSLSWLLTNAGIKPDTLQEIEKYITTRSQVYRIQVLGYFEEGGPTVRTEAIIDINTGTLGETNGGRPRILFQRDLSVLGKGFDLTENNN